MPLKLKPPRPGRSPYWYVRGTYLGIALDRSTQTVEERAARVILKRWRAEIERGKYHTVSQPVVSKPTFLAAAVGYMQADGERAFLKPIIEHAGPDSIRDMPLADIDQLAIDRLATALYPNATAQTRNRQIYTPVSAVLKRAGIDKRINRPKGWRGKKSVSWLEPEQAFALFTAADDIHAEFGLFLRLLCYTGMRLSEALGIKVGQIDLSRQAIYLPQTKNNDPRTVHLPPELVTTLASHPRGLDRKKDERLIRYHAGGRLRDMLKLAMVRAGLSFPRRQCGFHLFRHTWAAWMRRYGGLDTSGLVETGAWRDPKSAARYEHLDTSEEARKADKLPWIGRGRRA
jgi:integrase